MDSAKLSVQQRAMIVAKVKPMTEYLVKLQVRMRATEFPADNALYQKVGTALEAMRMLAVELHREEDRTPIDLGPKPTRGGREQGSKRK